MHLILGKNQAGTRVAILNYGSPSHRVVEQQLLIPGFLPEFLETSGDQENLRLLEKVATGYRTRDCRVEVECLDHCTTATS